MRKSGLLFILLLLTLVVFKLSTTEETSEVEYAQETSNENADELVSYLENKEFANNQ